MRARSHELLALSLCVVAGVFIQGCGGGRHNSFFNNPPTASPNALSIAFAGYVPVGAPRAFTSGNLTAQNATTLTFLLGLLPAGLTPADLVVLHRDDTTGSVTVQKPLGLDPVAQTVTVSLAGPGTYQAQAPVQPDVTRSTITVTPSSSIPADGTSAATILVTVRDASGTPLAGQTITVAASGNGNTLTQPSGPSDLLGQATARIVSTFAETKTLTATINSLTAKPIVLPTALVVFGAANTPGAATSNATANPGVVVADGVSTALVTIVVRDSNGTPLAGQNVGVAAVGTLALLTQPAPTDAAGKTVASIASPYPGNKTLVVTVGGVTLNARPSVTFVASGRNVYVGTNTPAFSVYTADDAPGATGQLRPSINRTPAAAAIPTSIAIDTRSRFCFSTEASQLISRPLANQDGTGAFDLFGGVMVAPLASPAFELAVTPSGRFVYAALRGSINIETYAADPATGLVATTSPGPLTPVFGLGGFQAGGEVSSIAMHPTGRFLYAVNFAIFGAPPQPSVVAFAIDPVTGALTRVGAPLDMGGSAAPGYIACDPQGRYLVGVDQTAQNLYLYGIDPATGELTELDEITLDGEAAKPIVDGTGRFIYLPMLTGPHSNAIEVFRVDASLLGAPGPVVSPRASVVAFPVGGGLRSDLGLPAGPMLATEPSGSFLTAIVDADNELVTFSIDPTTGALSNPQAVRTQIGPVSIATSIGASPIRYLPARLAVADAAVTSNVQAYTVNAATGALGAPAATTANPGATAGPVTIATDVLDRFVFTSDGQSSAVSVETVDPASPAFFATGTFSSPSPFETTLAQAGASPYLVAFSNQAQLFSMTIQPQGALAAPNATSALAAPPTGGGVDPTGQWIYALENAAPGIEVFHLTLSTGDTGSSTSTSTLVVGSRSLAFAPSGRFAYFQSGSGLLATSVISGTGAISPLASATVITQAPVVSVVADPFGKFVFALGQDGTVTGFSVNTAYQDVNEGELTQLGLASPVPGAMSPTAIAIDPSGNFLYVTDGATNTVTVLTINRSSGALTPGASSPAGVAPSAVVVLGGPR